VKNILKFHTHLKPEQRMKRAQELVDAMQKPLDVKPPEQKMYPDGAPVDEEDSPVIRRARRPFSWRKGENKTK